MPACFNLISKTTGQPTKFQLIDDELRQHLNEPADLDHWLDGWYDCVGLALATGKDWKYCREVFTRLDRIIDYLEENYSYNSWTEVGRNR